MAVFLVACTMGGCAAGAEAGKVVVEARAMSPDHVGDFYNVTVLGADGELIDSVNVGPNTTTTVENVPFGWVTIDEPARCSVGGELSARAPSIRLVMDAELCPLAN